MPLIVTRRDLRHGSLVDLPHTRERLGTLISRAVGVLLQAGIVEPDVVIARLVRELLLVLEASLAEDGRLDARTVAELLLKVAVGGVELSGAGAGEAVQGELREGRSQWREVDGGRRRRTL